MVRIDKVVTAGVFALDGDEFEVEDNIWLVGDDDEVIVIDAAHDADAIQEGVGERRVTHIICTHGHNDHINAAVDLARAVDAPVGLHASDRMLWDEVHPGRPPDFDIEEGTAFEVAGATLHAILTPGHTPGGVSLYDGFGHVYVGDTLFRGGPGATGRKYSDFDTIIESIRSRLLTLPPETIVHPGHGETTTIAHESPQLEEWVRRGY
jgi:glyoxylase-like metal-dependent hydrolase (beta-lactamase superfamily II)